MLPMRRRFQPVCSKCEHPCFYIRQLTQRGNVELGVDRRRSGADDSRDDFQVISLPNECNEGKKELFQPETDPSMERTSGTS